MAFILNVLKVLPLSIASFFGIAQAIVKFAKELITLIINILFPLFPDQGKFERTVNKARDIVNQIDYWLEKIKGYLVK